MAKALLDVPVTGTVAATSILVVGEFWQRAWVARSKAALAREGLFARSYDFRFGYDPAPRDYRDVLRQLLHTAPRDEILLLVPAGVLALSGFRRALERAATAVPENEWTRDLPGGLAWCRIRADDGTLEYQRAGRELLDCTRTVPATRAQPLPPAYEPGIALETPDGADTYQVLRATWRSPEELEPGITVLDAAARARLPGGWIYRCNNESIGVSLKSAHRCDTLIALASGIKAWYLANELRRSIARLIVIDASLPQLRFAHEVSNSLGTSCSWDDLCGADWIDAVDDVALRPAHETALRSIRAHVNEWRFDVHFVHCNFVTQTFRFLHLLEQLRVERPMLWYSNVFEPYLEDAHSEHHAGLQLSFDRLLRERYPDAVLFDSSVYPRP